MTTPPNARRRPQGAPTQESIATADKQNPLASRVAERPAVQLRRRRSASYRLQPMPDGRQDPWDPKTGHRLVMSITTDTTAGVALLRGTGARHLTDWLQMDPEWSECGRGLVVPIAAVPDLVAVAEWLRYIVTERERKP